jgi:hypothetical protein
VHWIGIQRFLDPAAADMIDYDHRGTILRLPCFRVDGRTIWGLTYQMLCSFFGVVGLPVV